MINTYSVMLNEDRIPYLRLDSAVEYKEGSNFNSPGLIVDMVNAVFDLENCAEEYMITVAMDAKCHIRGIFATWHGSVCMTEASPRNIIQRALLCGAATFVVCHNHPSGDCSPSKEDMKVAGQIERAGKLIGIPMSDFIVIGEDKYYSVREKTRSSV